MTEILETLASLSVLVFVISSMLSMGLSLKLAQIIEPLRNTRLVVLALVAKGNIPFSVGLMVLLMVVTIIYLPLMLPLLLGDVQVDPWAIAQSLIFMMLIPLGIGLFIKARYEDTAASLNPIFAMASNIAIIGLMVLGLVLNFEAMIALVGSLGLLAALIFVAIAMVIGYFLGGSDPGTRSVMGLGTGQRNLSAALVVAAQNFDSDVITYVLVIGVLGFAILMPAAGELGKRVKGEAPAEAQA